MALTLSVAACREKRSPTLFREIPSGYSGIEFENVIEESDSLNMLSYANFYTGAGVAVGDFNNDGLEDCFFGGNLVSSRLYLNKGKLRFEDITEQAGLITHQWINGIAIVDINQDGWLDIYLCVSGRRSEEGTRNLLFINNKDLTFSEQARHWGIDDAGPTTQAAFLDYDKDGDLDLFLAQNGVRFSSKVNYLFYVRPDTTSLSADKLYRNNGDGTFTDVSSRAGIIYSGYSLGLAVGDINGDGYDDIFISNDFQGNDLLYINNGDATFTERAGEYLRHSSYSGMGTDMSDVNRDGSLDILQLDMLAEGNERQKLLMEWPSYEKYVMSLNMGYLPQYTRNTLQISNGRNFSEVGQLAGIESTDWSWAPLFGDFDNDQDQDIFITNGFVRDLGDMDFVDYGTPDGSFGAVAASKEEILKRISQKEGVPLLNYLYENNGNLTFANRSKDWGINKYTFSYGASLSDLDNDGDLELIVNNSNAKAQIFENQQNAVVGNYFLTIRLKGQAPNLQGIGTRLLVYTKGGRQFYQHYPYRGYLSTLSGSIHFGLGQENMADSVRVLWPDGKEQVLTGVKAGVTLTVLQRNAMMGVHAQPKTQDKTWFENVTTHDGLDFVHNESVHVDFRVQPLIPHMLSQNGPGFAVGDVNNDGLDDLFVGGDPGQRGVLFLQQKHKRFKQVALDMDPGYEDMGALLFDADQDNDLDLVVTSGGTSYPEGSNHYEDRLYFNDGNGNFSKEVIIPGGPSSSGVVVGADYDKDGDIDLFIGGRVVPGEYPLTPRSKLLKNMSTEGKKGQFELITVQVEGLENPGMITSALWSDFDNDSWIDLIVIGEWMPLTIFRNVYGTLKKMENPSLVHTSGWWNSLIGEDFDKDGDIDYVAGNLGLNSRFSCSVSEPIDIYAKDFDNNGIVDPVLCMYINGEQHAPYFRGQLVTQLPYLKNRFNSFGEYARAGFFDLFSKKDLEGAFALRSETFASSYFENKGSGRFEIRSLPLGIQISPLYGMFAGDMNNDGNTDILCVGNSYANDAFAGRDDAGIGACLVGDGKGNFELINAGITGFRADHNAKGLVSILVGGGEGKEERFVISNNNGPLEVYRLDTTPQARYIRLGPDDVYANITIQDGTRVKHEFRYGGSYLSQSSRVLKLSVPVKEVQIVKYNGQGRPIAEDGMVVEPGSH